jgi:hypothetical protein
MQKQARETPGCGGNMYLRNDLAPEMRTLASEVFNRSWQFLERDPVLAGEDRESMQEQLAQHILVLMRNGEQNLLVIANKAIARLRERCGERAVEEAA